MPSNRFRTSQALLIDADGAIAPLPFRAPLLGGGLVVLARERCLFSRLDTPRGASSASAVRAARLNAEVGAPYALSGSAIARHGQQFGIWWWDAQWVADRLAEAGLDPAIKVLPEPFVRAAGEGWRIAKVSSGYEAQHWRGGFLLADLWRRRPFDAEAWRDFTAVQSEEQGVPAQPPPAHEAPFNPRSPYRRTLLSNVTPEQQAQQLAPLAAGAMICLTLFFLGRGFEMNRRADELRRQTDALGAAAARGAALQRRVKELASLKEAVQRPDAVVLLAAAQQALDPFGVKLTGFTADKEHVRLVLPPEAVPEVGEIAGALAMSAYFTEVKPNLDTAKNHLTIDMGIAGAKPKTAPRRGGAPTTPSLVTGDSGPG